MVNEPFLPDGGPVENTIVQYTRTSATRIGKEMDVGETFGITDGMGHPLEFEVIWLDEGTADALCARHHLSEGYLYAMDMFKALSARYPDLEPSTRMVTHVFRQVKFKPAIPEKPHSMIDRAMLTIPLFRNGCVTVRTDASSLAVRLDGNTWLTVCHGQGPDGPAKASVGPWEESMEWPRAEDIRSIVVETWGGPRTVYADGTPYPQAFAQAVFATDPMSVPWGDMEPVDALSAALAVADWNRYGSVTIKAKGVELTLTQDGNGWDIQSLAAHIRASCLRVTSSNGWIGLLACARPAATIHLRMADLQSIILRYADREIDVLRGVLE